MGNYRKGQAIKWVGILLGNGLMVSEGNLWKNQRRMIQPAFHRNAVTGLYEMMKAANLTLLNKWENSAAAERSRQRDERHQPVGAGDNPARCSSAKIIRVSRSPSKSCMMSQREACVSRKRSGRRGKSWLNSSSGDSAANQRERTF